MWQLLQKVAENYYKVRQVLQSVTSIAEWDRKLLESVTCIIECDRKLLLQSVMGITKYENYHKVRRNR